MNEQERQKVGQVIAESLTVADRALDGSERAIAILGGLLELAAAGTLTPELIDAFRTQQHKAAAVFANDRVALKAMREHLKEARLLALPTSGRPV